MSLAIYKLRKIKKKDLVISNKQMWLHLGSFAAFTLVSILLIFSFHLNALEGDTDTDAF